MRRIALLLAATSLVFAPPAFGLDLTGTWVSRSDGYMKCRYFDGTWNRSIDSNIGTLYITQVGTTLYVEINPGGADVYNNKFKGVVYDGASDPEKGAAGATACKIDGEYYHGAFSIPKAQADAAGGAMTVEWYGTNNPYPQRCKAKFERTSALDPGVTTSCP
jgi:hypothetical protein